VFIIKQTTLNNQYVNTQCLAVWPTYTLGGINLYTTGVTILDKIVELINPPINTIASGAISGFVDKAIGKRPPIAVKDVRTIGKNRTSPASLIASSTDFPCSLS